MTDRLLHKLIEVNAEMLDVPKIALKKTPADFFPSTTMRAMLEVNSENLRKSVLLINENCFDQIARSKEESVLVISHEMRHFWQAFTGAYNLENHTQDSSDRRAYNAQLEEIDAWAWSSFMTGYLLGLSPNFNNIFDQDIISKIKKREKEIFNEFLENDDQ